MEYRREHPYLRLLHLRFVHHSLLFRLPLVSSDFDEALELTFCQVVPNTNPSITNIVGSLCTSNVAGLPCNWTLAVNVRKSIFILLLERSHVIQLDFSGNSPFNTTVSSFVDDAGDTYQLKAPLKVRTDSKRLI